MCSSGVSLFKCLSETQFSPSGSVNSFARVRETSTGKRSKTVLLQVFLWRFSDAEKTMIITEYACNSIKGSYYVVYTLEPLTTPFDVDKKYLRPNFRY